MQTSRRGPRSAASSSPTAFGQRYEMLGEVARGGCAIVYEARDRHLDRVVAIKVLQPSGFDAQGEERLAREARVAAAVHHPNVCAVTDAGRLADGRPFLVMERLYGETLRQCLGRLGRLDADTTIDIALQILSGLEAVHALGIVHRDIKPDNIFLVQRIGCMPLVKLLDFGLCRRANAVEEPQPAPIDDRTLTRVGTVVGTPEYMAPEQAQGHRDFDGRIDLYAVGVVMYEALSGTRAFAAPDARQVLMSVISKALPPLRSIHADIPPLVDRIVARAVERNPRARYHTASEFLDDLLAAKEHLLMTRDYDSGEVTRAENQHDSWDMPTRRFRRTGSGYP